MVNPLTLTAKLPQGSEAHVFGSFLHSDSPRDLDVVIVYDTDRCHPCDAYSCHDNFISALRDISGLAVDLTLLTRDEAQSSHFLAHTGAVRLDQVSIGRQEYFGAAAVRVSSHVL